MRILILILLVIMITAGSGFGQNFQNLDFENATVVTDFPPNIIDAVAALPDWLVLDGTTQPSNILFNSGSFVSLWGSGQALDGNFSVGFNLNAGGSISQTGLIPTDARTLLFIGTTPTITGRLLGLSISGQSLQYVPVSSSPGYIQWGADISAFAGQTVTLTFSGGGLLDDIQFSPSLIPEPSVFCLLFLGSGILVHIHNARRYSASNRRRRQIPR